MRSMKMTDVSASRMAQTAMMLRPSPGGSTKFDVKPGGGSNAGLWSGGRVGLGLEVAMVGSPSHPCDDDDDDDDDDRLETRSC